ncbi:hypothetical protein AVEN_268456-1 [Araneus ventricosus]|uniref:Uncharacterized protein n=1 Tax=Araneus ventricosus TaxID=182803 RepID=A0A4Y2STJ1_ARAVE|nr:hypothetical protein AVEN_268456-1 [Araneus ventricosus]
MDSPLSESFVLEFKSYLDWPKISYQSLDEAFIINNIHLLDLKLVSRYQDMGENTMDVLEDVLEWDEIFKNRKRLFEFSDSDADDFLISPKKSKRSSDNKPKYSLGLSSNDGCSDKQISPYSINLGKGRVMEIKEFRSKYVLYGLE